MAIGFFSGMDPAPWRGALEAALGPVDFRVWPEIGDAADIEFALAWRPAPGALSGLVNLKAVLALGAGVESLLAADPPADVPVVRLADQGLVDGMTHYVVMAVLWLHRGMPEYADRQKDKVWRPLPWARAEDRRIGVLGLGNLGAAAARELADFGFDVRGWSRTKKTVDGVSTFSGAEALDAFLSQTDILVGLLPATEETDGLLNAQRLKQLPKGAGVVNVGRGALFDEAALAAALDADHLSRAILDVFRQEPLPGDHPFWAHPKITVTPHVASVTDPETAAPYLADVIKTIRAGRTPPNVVDIGRGY